MAFDKVIDSAALEAALKASADAIREKTGGSDTIPWDAVKGFADAIAAIEAGGGSGGGAGNISTGTVTFVASGEVVTIEHGLGKVPRVWALFSLKDSVASSERVQYENLVLACFLYRMEENNPTVGNYQSYHVYVNSAGSTSNSSVRAKCSTGLRANWILTEDASEIVDPTFTASYISEINKNYMKIVGEATPSTTRSLMVGRTYNWVVA